MTDHFFGYQRRDWIIALVIAVFMLLVVGTQLTPGLPIWVDDAAAYMAEGIAISNGTLEEQTILNYTMHPSDLPEEASESGLVYVWGFPLLLSLVHRMVGFDTVNYSTLIFYKLPSLLAFSLMAGVLFLFYRRYFREKLAAFLTLVFCVSGNMIIKVDTLYVDILFLFVALLSLWLAECFFATMEKPTSPAYQKALLATALGISLWYTNQTRLNGSTVVLIILLAHALRMMELRPRFSFRQLLLQVFPYAFYLALNLLSERLLLPATPNVSDIGSISLWKFCTNCYYYLEKTCDYLNSLSGNIWLFPIPLVLLVIGFFKTGFRLRTLPYTVLLVGTYAVLLLLPYTQGLRYLYNVLPIMVLYIGQGGLVVYRWLIEKKQVSSEVLHKGIVIAAMILLLLVYFPAVQTSVQAITSQGPTDGDVYSAEAVEMYHYIQENTEKDAVIAFSLPRTLYLNTGRVSYVPGINNHKLEDADYFLETDIIFNNFTPTDEDRVNFEPVFQNRLFTLYKLLK